LKIFYGDDNRLSDMITIAYPMQIVSSIRYASISFEYKFFHYTIKKLVNICRVCG